MREPSNYDLIVPSRSSSDAADKHHNSASDKQLGENNVWQEHHVMQINYSHWSIWYLQKCWFSQIKYLLTKIHDFRAFQPESKTALIWDSGQDVRPHFGPELGLTVRWPCILKLRVKNVKVIIFYSRSGRVRPKTRSLSTNTLE